MCERVPKFSSLRENLAIGGRLTNSDKHKVEPIAQGFCRCGGSQQFLLDREIDHFFERNPTEQYARSEIPFSKRPSRSHIRKAYCLMQKEIGIVE
jgi:hypothetical protein